MNTQTYIQLHLSQTHVRLVLLCCHDSTRMQGRVVCSFTLAIDYTAVWRAQVYVISEMIAMQVP